MDRLNEILHELGISKVKLAKFLGVSRQMIYNYLELDDVNKWPKDKKVLLFNLLGIKSSDEINDIKVNTDYIMDVETRLSSLFDKEEQQCDFNDNIDIYDGLNKRQKTVLHNIIELIKENMNDGDNNDSDESYSTYKYLYHFLQAMNLTKELKYILGYFSKASGAISPKEYAFDENEQFIFESILFSAMTLYNNGGASKTKLAEAHKRFENQIEHKIEEKMSRTMELNSIKTQALKELGYTEINEQNVTEIFEKIAEIQSRKVLS